MAVYGICVILSAIFSPYGEDVLLGFELSSMGLAAQFLFIAVYFITSRLFDTDELKTLLYVALAASAIVFAIGILQRFGLDVFDLYHGLKNKLFISTIGQHTFFSSYLVLFFMLGVYALWSAERGSALYKAAAVHLFHDHLYVDPAV